MRYHVSLGFPKTIVFPENEMNVIYTNHAVQQMNRRGIREGIRHLKIIPEEVIEVRTKNNGKISSLLIRKNWTKKYDILLSVRLSSKNTITVITGWKNNIDDHHSELNEKLYDIPDDNNSKEIDFIYAGK